MAAKPVKIDKDNEPIDKGMEEAGHKADIAMSRSDAAPDETPPDFAFGSGVGESIVEHGTVPPPPDFTNVETGPDLAFGTGAVEHGTVPPPPDFTNVETVDAVSLESDPAMADGPDFAFGSGAHGSFAQPGPITIPSPDETSASLIDDSDPMPTNWGSGPSSSGLDTEAAQPDDFEPAHAGIDSVPVPDAAPDDDTSDADLLID